MRHSTKTSLNVKTSSLIVLMHSAKKKFVSTGVCGRGVGPRCKEFIKFSHSFFEFISASCSLEPPIHDEPPVKIYFYRRATTAESPPSKKFSISLAIDFTLADSTNHQ